MNYQNMKETICRKYIRNDGYFEKTAECGLSFDPESGIAVEVHSHGCHRANGYKYADQNEMLYYFDNHRTVHFPQVKELI